MTLLHFSKAFCSLSFYANAFWFVFRLDLAWPQIMFCPCECTKWICHPFPSPLPLSFGFLFVSVKPRAAFLKVQGFREKFPHCCLDCGSTRRPQHCAEAVYVTDGCMGIPRTAPLSRVLDEHSCIWARSCSGNWWAGGLVLTEQKQWSCQSATIPAQCVCAVPCGCTQSRHCELGALPCALLGDEDVLAGPAWWAEAAGKHISVLFPHFFLWVGGGGREGKGHIWQGFCLLLCFESWETKHPGKLKVRSCSHLQHCQITVLASDVRNLKKFWTWLNPHCQGTPRAVFIHTVPFPSDHQGI